MEGEGRGRGGEEGKLEGKGGEEGKLMEWGERAK